MSEHALIGITAIFVLGFVAQWLAWRLRLPSILLLLLFGVVAGPVSGFLHPDELFGSLLFTLVSLAVAVILFEGGLSLRLSELRGTGTSVRNLVTVGAVVTWIVSTAAGHLILGLDWAIATLVGAILVVSGPTVIGPLLRHVRPTGTVSSILKWEGIVIDPIGASLALLVFEVILAEELQQATAVVAGVVLKTVLLGGLIGIVAAAVIILLFRRFLVPDFLQNPVALTLVVAAFALSNYFQEESGLFAVTVMGIVLANQRLVSIKHIVEFKENLRVLIISSLFILLSARLHLADLTTMGWGAIAFMASLIFIARPLTVWVSTLGSPLNWRERAFLAWVAPRGIVAAAVSSVFALRLEEAGVAQAAAVVPVVFTVIVLTVAVYGLTAEPVAARLGVAQAAPQGALIVGAHSWARQIASILQEYRLRVLLVDTNWDNVSSARLAGLDVFHGSIINEEVMDELDLNGIGRLLALTHNDEVNALAALHFAEIFSRAEVYQLAAQTVEKRRSEVVPKHLRGRVLFGSEITYDYVSERVDNGAAIKGTQLTPKFTYQDFRRLYGGRALPLFLINGSGSLTIISADEPIAPRPGQVIVALVDAAEPAARARQAEQSAALESG